MPPAGLAPGWPSAGRDRGGHQGDAGIPSRRRRRCSRLGAEVEVVQPSGAPPRPLHLICFRTSPPTRRDTRFGPTLHASTTTTIVLSACCDERSITVNWVHVVQATRRSAATTWQLTDEVPPELLPIADGLLASGPMPSVWRRVSSTT